MWKSNPLLITAVVEFRTITMQISVITIADSLLIVGKHERLSRHTIRTAFNFSSAYSLIAS